jgi:hypothetical protein
MLDDVVEEPIELVAVNEITKVPGAVNVDVGFFRVENWTPFFFHNQEVGAPLDISVNCTPVNGLQPEEALEPKFATG